MEPITGPGGVACFIETHESGAEVVVASHGGHVISWKTAEGKERLFLSEQTEFSPGKAIRGGVPVIFPQFSDRGPFGRHGFARKTEWTPASEPSQPGRLTLSSSESTREEWPFDFELSLQVVLSAMSLEMALSVRNTGSESVAFQAALHTYFRVDDVCRTVVEGLENRAFENEVTKAEEIAGREGITFGNEVDRAYLEAGDRSVVLREESDEALTITSEGFPDVVVWNPGPNHGIGDLPRDDWKAFVCVEAAKITSSLPLLPGAFWKGSQRIEAGKTTE